MSHVSVRLATAEDRPTVERLWLMFRHDLSRFMGVLPNPDGTFRAERVDSAFGEAGWAPYLFVREGRPLGFAFARGLDGPTRVLNSFFVVGGARREGIGLRAVREVVDRHPGHWEIAFQYDNEPAVRFWRRVAAELAPDAWSEETRPVPDRPDLPPDAWISFRTGSAAKEASLHGGAVNDVVRVGKTVRRSPSARSGFVRDLLTLFEQRGWKGAPRFLGTDESGRDVLDHVPGQAPLTAEQRAAARTDVSLVRVAQLVREFHDMTHGTPLAGDRDVVCHNDLAPKNTVHAVEGGRWWPLALIDWDLAAPGERIHDVAHLCWQFLDLGPGVRDTSEAARRIRLVCEAYGLEDRGALIDTILWWQDRCWRGIEAGAEQGEPAMVALRERGAVEEVRAAWEFVGLHRDELGVFL